MGGHRLYWASLFGCQFHQTHLPLVKYFLHIAELLQNFLGFGLEEQKQTINRSLCIWSENMKNPFSDPPLFLPSLHPSLPQVTLLWVSLYKSLCILIRPQNVATASPLFSIRVFIQDTFLISKSSCFVHWPNVLYLWPCGILSCH